MAMASYTTGSTIWNPDEQFDLDPETGEYRPRTPDWTTAAPAQSQTAAPESGYDIDAWYQRTLGRAPDANERTTDLANIAKYGAAGFESDFMAKRPNNTPGSGDYTPQQATAQYSGGGVSGANSGFAGPTAPTAFQSGLRDILMQQLGAVGRAPTVTDPGIAENLAGRRLALQRGGERLRRESAEQRAYDGSGGLGGKAYETDVRRILEGQAEAEARGVGEVLGGELQGRRQQLAQLLQLALATGDAEAVRDVQQRMQQADLAYRYAGLNQQGSQFDDDLAYRYTNLNQQGNLQALAALLGAL